MNLTAFIQEELYPSLFPRVREAFPEMDFKPYKGGWASRHKLNGELSHDKRAEKSIISIKQPNRILEQGGNSLDLISFYMDRNGISETIEAVKQLCSIVGLSLPEMEETESYRAYKEKQDTLEQLAKEMKEALSRGEGAETLRYLTEGRKYSEDFITESEFGFVGTGTAEKLRAVFTYMNRDGQEVCTLPKGTGTVYTLAIPYRSGGSIKGFVFRSILNEEQRPGQPKYKDAFISGASSKRYHLFGLTGLNLTGNGEKDRDITIVEGEIDALRAVFYGIPNVVAASGGEISPEALKEAKSKGVKRVTVLFDTEETEEKNKATLNKINKAIGTIQEAGLTPFVCSLPSDGGKADVDSYLQNHTGEQLKALIDEAIGGTLFQFNRITEEAIERQGGEDEQTTFKNLHEYKRRTIELCNSRYTTPTDRDIIFRSFAGNTGDFITKESLQEEADLLKMAEDKNRQREETISITAEALKMAKDGRAEEALSLLQEKAPELSRISRENDYSKLLLLPTTEGIKAEFKQRPTGVRTGYSFEGKDGQEELILPNGALTYICAPTSHGKSRMLENLAIQLAKDGTAGDVLYFSFEEDSFSVIQQLCNIYINTPLSANNLRSLNSYYTKGSFEYFKRDVSIADFQRKEAEFFSLLTKGKLRVYYKDYDSSELIEAIRYLHRNRPIKAVFVDYIQLLHKKGSRLQRKDELKEICKDFMSLAVDTGLPIVMAAQLNREAYSPIDMAVQNIAEASDIEHSANIVLLLWNSKVKPIKDNSYYTKKGGEQQLTAEAQRIEAKGFHMGVEGTLYATLAKNRGGARNIEAVFNFDGNTGYIEPNYRRQPPTQADLPFLPSSGKEDLF